MATSTIKKKASSQNGQIQIGNILIQYGTVSVKTVTQVGSTAFSYRGTETVTFERPYSSPPSVFANVLDWSAYWAATASGSSNTTLNIELSGNSNNATKYVSWLAIGTI